MTLDFKSPYIREEHVMFRQAVKEFVDAEIRPVAMKHNAEAKIERALLNKMAEMGFMGMAIPEEFGGAGADPVSFAILGEEIARACASTSVVMGAHGGIGTYGLVLDGSDELKKKYLPKLATAESIGCFCLTEPQAGSDAANIKTRAVRDGDDWILNGEKIWITNGDIADVMTVFAVTDPALGAKGGVTAFVVERGPGVVSGPKEHKMGLAGSGTTTVTFENVRVPQENVLGTVGLGFLTAMKILDKGRLFLGAAALGMAKEAYDLAVNHATQRQQFGKPIADFQAIQFYLAEMATRIYAMEQMVYHSAWLMEQGEPVTQSGSMVKLFCTEHASWVINHSLQIHGGMGYSSELPIERMFRDARIFEIFEGTNEIQKVVIARELLKDKKKELARV
ncbi:MAG: acyl-CoA dehydrogenase family protein [Candidatus Sericytochromatia bacterium]